MSKLMIIGAVIASVFLAGCGKRMEWDEEVHDTIAIPGVTLLGIEEADQYVNPNYADALYYESYRKGFGTMGTYRCDLGHDTACSKRKAAIDMSREVWSYSFKGYVSMDGVSSLLYNVGYLFSAPHKLIRGLFCMDGVVCYIGAVFNLLLGIVCAIFGIVAQTLVGFLCHPFETLANLTIGLFGEIFGENSYSGLTYTKYILHTNIIATLWDLVWGSILYPLLQAVLFWL